MESFLIDLFPFISRLLATKYQQVAYFVSIVYIAAIAKLKAKSLTIEPISVGKLEELISHSHYKFDFVGDIQACALVSINTLIALSARNKSWLSITKLYTDYLKEEDGTKIAQKFQWKISMPPVKGTEKESAKNYIVQCICVSNAPKDFVLYVTDVKLFNIVSYWNKSDVYGKLNSKMHIECRVEEDFPLIAKSAVLSGVLTGEDISAEDYDDVLAEYFLTPRLLKVGDVIHVDLLNCGDHLRTRNNFYKLPSVYLKVISLKGECNSQQYYVLKGYTELYMNPLVHSYLPPRYVKFIKTVDEIPGFDIPQCPEGLMNYFRKLEKVYKLLIKRGNIEGMILLTGPKGSGKKTTVEAVSNAFGFSFIRANCFDFYGITPSLSHMKLGHVFAKARISAPCTLFLENIELLGREQNHNESTRLIDVFESNIKELQIRKSDLYPLLVVGSTQAEASEVVPAIARMFIHVIPFKAPTPEETYLSMKWLLKHSNMLCTAIDLQKVVERIRGYVFADLALLVQHAIHIRNTDTISGDSRTLNLEHFTKGIDIMENAYSDSIGAARVPKVFWEDIGGLAELKEEIMLTLNLPIQHPELFTSGLKRSGILFYGPPGTGKTLMAKAVATECSYNFLSVKGPELMNMYVGQSEKNVREVFERAREASPCVIFFDELDSLAPSRGKSGDSGGVTDRVVSQLLAEMDGLDKNKDVFVIAATNRPDLIDSALLRPGRFDKMFYVGVCKDTDSKLSVLKALTRRFNLSKNVDFEDVIAKLPTQVTGADLYSVCSNAWFAAARRAVDNIENGGKISLPLEVFSEDFSQAVAEFVPSLTAQDIDYYENLKSS